MIGGKIGEIIHKPCLRMGLLGNTEEEMTGTDTPQEMVRILTTRGYPVKRMLILEK